MNEGESNEEPRLRIDKWLWAARFFKTRSLAAQAVDGGRVRLNGERVKPAKALRLGDELTIHIGALEWVVAVRGLSGQRRSAPEAQRLYEEREASRALRAQALAERKAGLRPHRVERGRPTKKDRRMIRRFTED
jgi:ribosome-associated heat shock protein Hsp15